MAHSLGLNPSLLKEVSCRNCAHRIAYVEGDVRNLWSGKDYGGCSSGSDGFSCPNCSKDIIVRSW